MQLKEPAIFLICVVVMEAGSVLFCLGWLVWLLLFT